MVESKRDVIEQRQVRGGGMKTCPFCAEDVQEAAIVCKHCGRDLNRAVRWKRRVIIAGIAVIALMAISAWLTTPYGVNLASAREFISGLEARGLISNRKCSPNEVVIPFTAWVSLTTPESKKGLMMALARLCIAEGGGPTMAIKDSSGRVYASFNGSTLEQ
ncbi:MAG: hypothetical protein A3H95_06355 [Acidobacteria bacterium RIFCSPLOWO2_02_FULL_64_15]|nr:MAG: hypothetical protein A3H95_06355 [Acidobacteria bacterium RIFCSPLOWO2_02_FULL_64_15]